MELVHTVQTANEIRAADVSALRQQIMQAMPIEAILDALNFEGEITPETTQAAMDTMMAWAFGDTDFSDGIQVDPNSFVAQVLGIQDTARDAAGDCRGLAGRRQIP